MRLFIVLLIILIVFIPVSQKRIAFLKKELNKKMAEIAELQEKRALIREVEELLKTAPPSLELVEPSKIDLEVAPLVAQELAQNLLKSLGIKGEVIVEEPVPSPYFPGILNIYEVPLELGLEDYNSYGELVKLLALMRETPLYVESFEYGGGENSYKARGKLHFRCKFLFIEGG